MGRGESTHSEALSSPPTRGFRTTRQGDLRLVVPTDNKHLWQERERIYRSAILDATGRIVSLGYPKFFNAGEDAAAADRRRLVDELQSGADVFVEAKLDGSLIIRSVIEGQVVFRTRRTFDGGELAEPVLRIAKKRYPSLADPSVEPDRSLLFEFLSADPRYQVIIAPAEEDLVFLDAIDHSTQALTDRTAKEALALDLGLNLVESHPLPASLGALEREIKGWKGREGVVIRFDRAQRLLKVKSRAYLELHRLKHKLTAGRLRDLCESESVNSPADFDRVLERHGGDWEIFSECRPMVDAYCRARAGAIARIEELDREVDALFISSAGDKQKVKESINSLDEAERQASLLLFDGRFEPARERLIALMVDEALAPFAASDDDLVAELFDES